MASFGSNVGGDDDNLPVSIDQFKEEQHSSMQKYLNREKKKKQITEAEFRANFPDAPSIDFKNITILHRFTLRPDEAANLPSQLQQKQLAGSNDKPGSRGVASPAQSSIREETSSDLGSKPSTAETSYK